MLSHQEARVKICNQILLSLSYTSPWNLGFSKIMKNISSSMSFKVVFMFWIGDFAKFKFIILSRV